jgi:hypothetical protein
MSCLNFIKRSKAERSRGGKMKYGVSGHDRRITFSTDNSCLAQACQIANSACCTTRKLSTNFLTRKTYVDSMHKLLSAFGGPFPFTQVGP